MLGTGLIGDFYTMTLHGQRGADRVRVVYSRTEERGEAFSERWDIPEHDHRHARPPSSTPTPTSSSSPCPTTCTRRRSRRWPRPARRCCAPSRSAGPRTRRAGCSRRSSRRASSRGYLEDLCYTPKTLKAIAVGRGRRDRRGHLGALTRDPPGPALGVVLGRPADRRRRHHRPRAATASRSIRNFVGKGNRPVEVMCHTDTLVHPIDDEDNAIALIRFESGAIGQFEVSLDVPGRHGPARRGRRHPRHDLAQPLPAHRVRDVHGRAASGGYVAEKAETSAGWLFPVGDEVVRAGLRGHVHGHVRRHR